MAGAGSLTPRVLVDAGPLIALSKVGALHVLRDMFIRVATSEQVRAEVLRAPGRPGVEELRAAFASGWLIAHAVDLDDWQPGRPGIDSGEASILFLASLLEAPLLIVDDRAARLEARSCGHALIGTAGIIGLARSQGYIPAAKPVLLAMREQGYFLGDDVIAAVLTKVGEAA